MTEKYTLASESLHFLTLVAKRMLKLDRQTEVGGELIHPV